MKGFWGFGFFPFLNPFLELGRYKVRRENQPVLRVNRKKKPVDIESTGFLMDLEKST